MHAKHSNDCPDCTRDTGELINSLRGLVKAGTHKGKCKFDMPNGSCSKHFLAYEKRLQRANKILAKIPSGVWQEK